MEIDRFSVLTSCWDYGYTFKYVALDQISLFYKAIESLAEDHLIDPPDYCEDSVLDHYSNSSYKNHEFSYYWIFLRKLYYYFLEKHLDKHKADDREYFSLFYMPELRHVLSWYKGVDLFYSEPFNLKPKGFFGYYSFLRINDRFIRRIYGDSIVYRSGGYTCISKDLFLKLYAKVKVSDFYSYKIDHCCFCLDFSGGCSDPVLVIMYYPDQVVIFDVKYNYNYFFYILCRCRRCSICCKSRGMFWLRRAQTEVMRSSRTWFVTLTFSPSNHIKNYALVVGQYVDSLSTEDRDLFYGKKKYGTIFEDLTILNITDVDLKFRLLCKGFGDKIVLFLKRLRKNTSKKFRYFVVFERHKSGDPHAHMLIHQKPGDELIKKAEIQEEWMREGFSHVRLLREDLKTARYVCKYLLKEDSKGIRVRASFRYGSLKEPSEG
ncbi:hypothetical protein CKC_03515 [Candidatus Liberibacter solanacearum CLso-ZC1]|uniref:Replication-associated protein ORF2/G2P domain-containing protein n=1 Tax=Liberibacter solanacearum (strain CLso-ZC1) TaxID=658172 RepID=E4UBE7_LIBSC|nr:hypothetical protein [Candidatus Liberibacter solanacearum]ADR52452.1 hypothetical protein CKC_03515 [Candidatus Liberibacter solanacearum CLso-ZC1]